MWVSTMTSVGRARLPLRCLDGHVNHIEVVHVADVQHIPVPGLETQGHVIAEGQRCAALDGDVVVVVEPDQVRESQDARRPTQLRCLRLPSESPSPQNT